MPPLLKHTIKQSEDSITRLTVLYVFALSAIAILTIMTQVLVQRAIGNQQHDATIVNLSGRQRFQSQAIVKLILILTDSTQPLLDQKRKYYQMRLENFVDNWHSHHLGLKQGYMPEYKYDVKNSEQIDSLFTEIEPHFQAVYTSTIAIKGLLTVDQKMPKSHLIALRDTILAHEFKFLDIADQIVYQFDKEATAKVAQMRRAEVVIMFVTLFLLMLEGILIFRPAAMHIERSIEQLVESENNVKLVNSQLLEANIKLENAQIELLLAEEEKFTQRLNEQRIRSASLIQGQDAERRRISLELHDGIGQMLTALKLAMDNLVMSNNLPEKEKNQALDIKNLVGDVLKEVRGISFNLMPSVLNDFGLVSALSMMAEKASANGTLHILFEHNLDPRKRLDKKVEVGLYRIAQEAINNALKYSESTRIKISLSEVNQNLALNISDNGKGFNIKKLNQKIREEKKFSIGLNSMEERANQLNGEFRIISSVGKGTKIYVKLPSTFTQ